VRNERDADNSFRLKVHDLLIVALNIPETNKAPLNTEQEVGLSFLERLRDDGFRKPSIIIADHLSTKTNDKIEDLETSVPLLRGTEGWEVNLQLRVRQQLNLSVAKPKKKTCWIDIRLDLGNRSGDYQIKGNFFNEVRGIIDQVNFRKLKNLLLPSRIVGNIEAPDSLDLFHNIGEELHEQLQRRNYDFDKHFTEAICAVGSDEDVRIRFVVTTSLHPLAFEAFLDDRAEHWMLRSPVYRKIEARSGVTLCEDDEEPTKLPIRKCLIIVADTQGVASGLSEGVSDRILPPLKHVDNEGSRLEEHLIKKGVVVRRLGGSSKYPATKGSLIEALKQGPWDTVHFAGHSFWDEKTGSAMIFLPGEENPQVVGIEPLAVLLRAARARLVYLSSCKSSGCGVELARKQIPSIVGYRWDIDDELSAEHAEVFYTKLFEDPESIEIALLRTRQQMRRDHGGNPIWASSVLIRQTDIS
jgi:hypothetical protein